MGAAEVAATIGSPGPTTGRLRGERATWGSLASATARESNGSASWRLRRSSLGLLWSDVHWESRCHALGETFGSDGGRKQWRVQACIKRGAAGWTEAVQSWNVR